MLAVLSYYVWMAILLIWFTRVVLSRKPPCRCNGLLRYDCPQHGWPVAEPLGASSSDDIEWLIHQYLKHEAHDAAWFEAALNGRLVSDNHTYDFGPALLLEGMRTKGERR